MNSITISSIPLIFYFVWPLLVVIYTYKRNNLGIEKKRSFILVALLVNYFVFVIGFIVLSFVAWQIAEALHYLFGLIDVKQTIRLALGIIVSFLVYYSHILITRWLVKKWCV